MISDIFVVNNYFYWSIKNFDYRFRHGRYIDSVSLVEPGISVSSTYDEIKNGTPQDPRQFNDENRRIDIKERHIEVPDYLTINGCKWSLQQHGLILLA